MTGLMATVSKGAVFAVLLRYAFDSGLLAAAAAQVVVVLMISSAPQPDGVRRLPGRAGRGRTWR